MAAIGGSIESLTLNGRLFSVPADSEFQRKLGGFENEVQANGDGTARIIKTRVPLSVSGGAVAVDDDRGDQEFLNGLTKLQDFFPVAVTYASGSIYQGTAMVTGEIQYSNQNASAAINLMGGGELTKQ